MGGREPSFFVEGRGIREQGTGIRAQGSGIRERERQNRRGGRWPPAFLCIIMCAFRNALRTAFAVRKRRRRDRAADAARKTKRCFVFEPCVARFIPPPLRARSNAARKRAESAKGKTFFPQIKAETSRACNTNLSHIIRFHVNISKAPPRFLSTARLSFSLTANS